MTPPYTTQVPVFDKHGQRVLHGSIFPTPLPPEVFVPILSSPAVTFFTEKAVWLNYRRFVRYQITEGGQTWFEYHEAEWPRG